MLAMTYSQDDRVKEVLEFVKLFKSGRIIILRDFLTMLSRSQIPFKLPPCAGLNFEPPAGPKNHSIKH